MNINKALLKYGYSNFKFEILEFCSRESTIEREDYYFHKLKPEYNIQTPGYYVLAAETNEKRR